MVRLMANGETVDRILRAATILFAERGFAETSLRTITGMADVNLAAVNYHFGSKKSLIQAVFSHFLTPFCRELDQRLRLMEASLQPKAAPSAEDLLRILLESLATSISALDDKPEKFMRLLGLAYTQSQDHLRQYLNDHFGATYNHYIDWLKRAAPHLDAIEFYWRINFILGACIFTIGSFESLQVILRENQQHNTDMQGTTIYLVDALAGMLVAPRSALVLSKE